MSKVLFFEPDSSQFRVRLEGDYYAIVKFEVENGVYVITSTKVPEELRGKGYGKVMMEAVLPELEKMAVKVKPVCSYVVHYLERNPQWAHLKV